MSGDGEGDGDWLAAMELLDRGDPAFVDAIRAVDAADALAAFAGRWLADSRPASRRLLLDYLDRPLNAYRHEGLIKRLFKLAEAAGDDAVMARFLVLFDRSVRRVRRRRTHHEFRQFADGAEARATAESWTTRGYDRVSTWSWGKIHSVRGSWSEVVIAVPRRTAMPRGSSVDVSFYDPKDFRRIIRHAFPDWMIRLKLALYEHRDRGATRPSADQRRRLETYRLFSTPTRNYLRRRAWRYVRNLGKSDPSRYAAAASDALTRYEDDDARDALALLDNWGLVHILFHRSPALVAQAAGWLPAEGHEMASLAPAPIFPAAWRGSPGLVVALLSEARSRPVRQWAAGMIRADPAAYRGVLGLGEVIRLLGHADPDVVALAGELLRTSEGLGDLGVDRWLALAETTGPEALALVCELMAAHVAPESITLAQAVRLAASRPAPVARLGLSWLVAKPLGTDEDARVALALVEAECGPARPAILRWLRGALAASPAFRADWVVEVLDSRRPDARAEGLAWLGDEPRARDDVTVWNRLIESPYDDVRAAVLDDLEARYAGRDAPDGPDPGAVRLLWATVLLNIHRGGRSKPRVVDQVCRRLAREPGEAGQLLPLLGMALRSVRGPEWRAGLAGVVRLVERRPELAGPVAGAFPELQWEP